MRILITGANGFIGGHLTQALLDQGHEILACVRSTTHTQSRWPQITVLKVDFSTDHSAGDWIPRLTDVDVVINAVGIIRERGSQTFDALHTHAPRALFQACEMVGVKRVIQISALGADESAFSHYHRSKHSADCYLRESSIDWAILMPSIVYGPGAQSMALFKAIAALPVVPLTGKGDQRIQPIHISDVTEAVVQLLDSDQQLRTDIEMVGPYPITMKCLYGKLRDWLGMGEGRYFSVPYRLVLLGAYWAGLLGRTPITEEAVRMLQKGNTGTVDDFIDRFDFAPKSIDKELSSTPAQQSDRWHAELYFLAPILRISIAFVWMCTGYISACVFPVEQSYFLLSQVGIVGIWQPIFLYGAAAIDLLLGVATLFSLWLPPVVLFQISLISLYSIIIAIWLPEYWVHPFGTMSKNLPLVVATLIMLVLERRG